MDWAGLLNLAGHCFPEAAFSGLNAFAPVRNVGRRLAARRDKFSTSLASLSIGDYASGESSHCLQRDFGGAVQILVWAKAKTTDGHSSLLGAPALSLSSIHGSDPVALLL